MKNSYFEAMLKDLVEQSGHPGVNKVEPFTGFEFTHAAAGLTFEFVDGAAMHVKMVSTSPPSGGHSAGPDSYEPGTVTASSAVPDGGWPTKVRGYAQWLKTLTAAAGHDEITGVEVRERRAAAGYRVSLVVNLSDGAQIFGLWVRAQGPGGKRPAGPDFVIAEEMV